MRSDKDEVLPKLTVNAVDGFWSYLIRGMGLMKASYSLEVNGATLSAKVADEKEFSFGKFLCDDVGVKHRFTARYTFGQPTLKWRIWFDHYVGKPYTIVGSTIRNLGNIDLRLGKCRLLDLKAAEEGHVNLRGDLDKITFFSETGTQEWSRVKRITSDDGRHVSQTIGHIFDPTVPLSLNFSFATFDRAKTECRVRCDAQEGIQHLEAYCDFDDFTLHSGESIKSERLFIDLRSDPYASLETWAGVVNNIYKPRIWERLPTGWVGWAWVDHFKEKPYEDIVMENVQAIQKELDGFGLQYIWASIGNLWRDTPGYWLKENEERFPHGLKWLVNELKNKGLKLGLWCGAFWIAGNADNPYKHPWLAEIYEEMKNAFLKKGGKYVFYDYKWPYGYWADIPRDDRPIFFCLDPTHPKTYEWLRKTFSEYRKLGVRYYMIDFLIAVSGSTPGRYLYDEYYNKTLIKGPEAYRSGLKVIRETAGPNTYLLASSGPTVQNVGLVDGVRVGPDYGEGRPVIPDTPYTSITRKEGPYRTYRTENWGLHKYTGCKMAANYFTHRKLYINDSCNLLTVDGDIPLNEAQISTTLFGICGGPMMLGDNLPTIQPERLALIKKCLPRYPDIAKPVDLFSSVYPEDYPKVFNLRVERPWGAWNVVAVFNYDEPELEVQVIMKELGLDREKKYFAYDFWDERFLGIVKNDMTIMVPAHSVKLLNLQEKRNHPWVLSTDMHITQGAVELRDLRWNGAEGILSGSCERPKGEKGILTVYLPEGYKIGHTKNAQVVKVDNQVVQVKLEFVDRIVSWEIALGKP